MRPGNVNGYGILGFFVPPAAEGEELGKYEESVIAEIDSEVWLICMTLQGWGYQEVISMPESERKRWAEKCEEYQDKVQDEIDSAKSGH